MAQIFPFAAYRFDTSSAKLEQLLTQPYDKITPAMQERYYSLHPHNLVAVEKGRALPTDTPQHNVYTRAAAALESWISQRVLVREPAPAIYVYFQDFQVPHSTERKTRKGFIALGRVEDYSAGVVFRHEQTLAGPRADRLELLRHTHAHTGQLFMLYDGASRTAAEAARTVDALLDRIAQSPAPAEMRDEYGVLHRLWLVTDAATIQQFVSAMAPQKLVIADGHHRYETALAYRNERRAALGTTDLDAAHEKVMMTFVNTRSEGLVILPTHRVVANVSGFQFERFRAALAAWFDCRAMALTEFRRELTGANGRTIGVYAGGQTFHLFTLRSDADLAAALPDVSAAQRELDVVLLHRLVLEKGLGITAAAVTQEKNITYEREMDAAIAAVDKGAAQLCCLLNPVRIEQVVSMALGGEVLPQKSTDFYPKMLSGLTIYRLKE